MEESLSLLDAIKKEFEVEEVDIRTYSGPSLAFLGDCVFEIIVRSVLVARGNRQSEGLHNTKAKAVNAKVQAQMIEALMDELTDDEIAVYKRGRNAKPHSKAKNAAVGDYRKATGLEAMFGYLYLSGQEERAIFLVKHGLELVNITI